MIAYKCKNFGSCNRADSGEELTFAAGADDKCPECGITLTAIGGLEDDSKVPTGFHLSKQALAGIAGALVVLVGVPTVYMRWAEPRVVELKPERTAINAVPMPATATAPSKSGESSAIVSPPTTGLERPAPMTVNELAARKTCEEATKAKEPDAERICLHASAVTLMNSGVLYAVDGKLALAAKDYLAARDKDPDFAELYFNIAVLKARQNKGTEAIDNLSLAAEKGFTQFAAIKTEPALQRLKADPSFKKKIEAFESK